MLKYYGAKYTFLHDARITRAVDINHKIKSYSYGIVYASLQRLSATVSKSSEKLFKATGVIYNQLLI